MFIEDNGKVYKVTLIPTNNCSLPLRRTICTFCLAFQECVPERKDLKQGVYDKIDKLLLDDAILASSASALLPSILAEKITHKNRFIVAHPVGLV